MTGCVKSIAAARARRGLLLAFVSDSAAMPVHWYYEASEIFKTFGAGGIQRLEDAPAQHPFGFMSTPEPEPTSGKRVVGDIILKTAAVSWGKEKAHPHCSLKAGDITLNADVVRLALRTVAEAKGAAHSAGAWRQAYVAFMTADPQPYKDTFAEGFHRNFFTKVAAGADPKDAADASAGVDSAGGVVLALPIVITELLRLAPDAGPPPAESLVKVKDVVDQHICVTHNRGMIRAAAKTMVDLVAALLWRPEATDATADAAVVDAAIHAACAALTTAATADKARALAADGSKSDTDVIGVPDGDDAAAKARASAGLTTGMNGLSCPLPFSVPVVSYFAMKYKARPRDGVLANINIGGENVHRGFWLGVVLGMAAPAAAPVEAVLTEFGIAQRRAIEAEIDAAFAAIGAA